MLGPTLSDISAAAATLDDTTLLQTPILPLSSTRWDDVLPACASATVKLELFQQAGSFKARGAVLGVRELTDAQCAAGIVAVSAGNHALAVSWAAAAVGVDVLITMPKTADPCRVEGCKALGATVQLYDNMAEAFEAMRVAADAGRTMIHPYEGMHMTLGGAVCGREYHMQAPHIDTFVVPVGGGGLISGMACAIKQLRPQAHIIGVEPFGADSMFRSFAAGEPKGIDKVDTIADSLGAPFALPFSFSLTHEYVDQIVRVTDDEMLQAMGHYQHNLGIMAEPACVSSLAAILGPLKNDLADRHVGIIACGSNISLSRYAALLGVC